MFEDDFQKRLHQLRIDKNVSARDMSLSIGQNAGYISWIENGWGLPSMSAFLSICDYLNITPSEFFDTNNAQPERMRRLIKQLQTLDLKQFNDIANIVDDIAK